MNIYPQDLGVEAERLVHGLPNVYTDSTRPMNFDEPSTWAGWVMGSLAVGTIGSLFAFVCGTAIGAVELGGVLLLITGVVTMIVGTMIAVVGRWYERFGLTRNTRLIRKQKRAQGPLTAFKISEHSGKRH